uniref:Secreted protein n=1 Tax=Arundo donax TaxID=35708 RepID=A0A0A8Y2S4_ARUDO
MFMLLDHISWICRLTSFRKCILLQVVLLERATRNTPPGYVPQLIFSDILICSSNTIGCPLNTVRKSSLLARANKQALTISFRLHMT